MTMPGVQKPHCDPNEAAMRSCSKNPQHKLTELKRYVRTYSVSTSPARDAVESCCCRFLRPSSQLVRAQTQAGPDKRWRNDVWNVHIHMHGSGYICTAIKRLLLYEIIMYMLVSYTDRHDFTAGFSLNLIQLILSIKHPLTQFVWIYGRIVTPWPCRLHTRPPHIPASCLAIALKQTEKSMWGVQLPGPIVSINCHVPSLRSPFFSR